MEFLVSNVCKDCRGRLKSIFQPAGRLRQVLHPPVCGHRPLEEQYIKLPSDSLSLSSTKNSPVIIYNYPIPAMFTASLRGISNRTLQFANDKEDVPNNAPH